jgi:hypothetical protein
MTVKTCVPLVFDVGIEVGNMRTCKQRNASGPAEEFQCYPEGELTVHTIYGVENGERCADVGREQTHQLQQLRSAYEEYDAIFRSFRAAILRSDAAEKVNTQIPEWIPLSVD